MHLHHPPMLAVRVQCRNDSASQYGPDQFQILAGKGGSLAAFTQGETPACHIALERHAVWGGIDAGTQFAPHQAQVLLCAVEH